MKKLRVGVAGLGDFGLLHMKVFSQIPYVEITRVCSRTASRAREVADQFGVPAISTDYADFAQADDVDVISVVTLGKDHRAVVVPALQAGKHVLVEKPMADTVEDARAMATAAQRSSGKFMVAHICRFMPQYYRAKELVTQGRLGHLSMIQTFRNNHYTALSPDRKNNTMRETAIHDIDLALWITGSDVAEAHGFKRYNQSDKEADSCLAVVKLANGTLCSFAASWLRRDAMPADVDAMMKIMGTQGELEIRMPPQNMVFIDDHEHSHFNPEVASSPAMIRQTALGCEIEYFLTCVLNDKVPEMISADEAVKAVDAAIRIDACCQEVRP
ncbi:MAG: Gfo/Idh/MocA family oxidoreductase [Kiritimatiellaeota bacterium]|nr:Gfo/Idh/MocA family oxidoreductase [Kiritimatiellota bacterium]